MSAPRIVKLGILADVSDLLEGLNKANGAVDGSASKFEAGFKKVAAATVAAGAAVATFAIALGKASIQEAIQAEAENNRLATILKNTGATNEQIEALNKQADALERVGVVSGGNIKVVQSQLATFDLSAAAIQRLTPAILDYVTAEKGANASAEDFRSATNGLAQALNGNFASLTKTGFVLDETTKKQISSGTEAERAAAIVKVLNSTYEGFNETLTETAEGRLIQLRNNFDQIKERIGNVLLPVLQQLTEFFVAKILPVIDDLVARFETDAVPAIDKVREVLDGFLLPALQNVWQFIKQFIIPTLVNLFKPAFDLVGRAVEFLSDKIRENREGLETARAIFQRVFEFVRDHLAPVLGGALATAFNLLTRLIGQAIDNIGKFFEIIGKVARFLGIDLDLGLNTSTKAVNNLDSGIVSAYQSFQEQSRTVREEVVPGLLDFDRVNQQATASADRLTEASRRTTAQLRDQLTVAQRLEAIGMGFGGALGSTGRGVSYPGQESRRSQAELVSQFGGLIPGFNQLPTDPFFGFGQGDDIRTWRRSSDNSSNNNSGNTININVTGTVVDPEGTARAIQSVLQQSAGRAGNLPLGALLGIE